jgi:hypothetical protein
MEQLPEILFDFISRQMSASPNSYEMISGNRQNRLTTPIPSMSLGELIDTHRSRSSG